LLYPNSDGWSPYSSLRERGSLAGNLIRGICNAERGTGTRIYYSPSVVFCQICFPQWSIFNHLSLGRTTVWSKEEAIQRDTVFPHLRNKNYRCVTTNEQHLFGATALGSLHRTENMISNNWIHGSLVYRAYTILIYTNFLLY